MSLRLILFFIGLGINTLSYAQQSQLRFTLAEFNAQNVNSDLHEQMKFEFGKMLYEYLKSCSGVEYIDLGEQTQAVDFGRHD
ncbi:MAG: hypothetical protein R3C61_04230 [Bacteroidia bacterium]